MARIVKLDKQSPYEIAEGTELPVYICACGLSKNKPFCDGSHKGTGFEPREFIVEAKTRIALCQCKHTHDSPRCDGTHKTL